MEIKFNKNLLHMIRIIGSIQGDDKKKAREEGCCYRDELLAEKGKGISIYLE